MSVRSWQNPMAARIVTEETDKMIIATKQLFYAMEVHKLLHFKNPDMSAVSFAMTIHGLMDYELDQSNGKCSYETDKNLLYNSSRFSSTSAQLFTMNSTMSR